ncbi:6634_t:CDS:10 [Paraglomus brasilianum]|uniref:Beige protein homolog 1 n=1 Tax=Paraglomus brasilianum TaxID=144538 RepID=A0A9N8Z3F7_9GLOM|nr:6634_t:CDS:10 [Paraglomus brasilianum]
MESASDSIPQVNGEPDSAVPEIVQRLAKLIAKSEEWQEYGRNFVIKDTHTLDMLIKHLSDFDDSLQKTFLNRLIHLAEYCDMNKWILFKTGTTSKLLKTMIWTTLQSRSVVECTIRLLEIVCAYSVRVSEIKLILNMICHENETASRTEDARWYHGLLVKLLYSIAQKENTLDFFYFKGTESGLILQDIDKFPINGYSFFTWIKLDACKHQSNDQSKNQTKDSYYAPRMFSFIKDTGDGIEAYFENNELRFQCRKGENVSTVAMTTLKFTHNRWYFVVITHSPARRGWKSSPSELRVVVNGSITWKTKLDYPVDIPNESFNRCAIGASLSQKKFDKTTHKADAVFNSCVIENSFRGQMTDFHLIADTLTKDQIQYIHGLGRNYLTQLSSHQLDGSVFDATRMIFSFHVKASDGQTCFNLAAKNQTTGGPQSGTLFETEKCSTLSLQSAIRSLGDIEVLFPMILRFDHMDLSANQEPLELQDDFFALEGPCKAFFSLITALLQNNIRSQNHIVESRGIKVISLLLQQVGPKHLSITAFQSMVGLATALSSNEEICREVYNCLTFEFRLWMYASMDIQKYCVQLLKNFADSRKQMSRENFGVQFFLEALDTVYWYKQNDRSAPQKHAATGATRPKVAQLKELRTMVLGIIRGYIKDSITEDEISCIFRNVSVSGDDQHICEVLTLLGDIIQSNSNKNIVDNIYSCGGYELLCELLKRREENIRLSCINLIIVLITCQSTPPQFVKKLRFEDMDPLLLVKLLDGAPLTLGIYNALLGWATEQQQPKLLYGNGGSQSSNVVILPLKNMKIIVVILALLQCHGIKRLVQCKILEELTLIFKHSSVYCADLDCIWSWQRFLVRIIPTFGGEEELVMSSGNKDIGDWALDFISCVIWNLFDTKNRAVRVIEETVVMVWISERPDCMAVIRALLSQILSRIAHDIRKTSLTSLGAVKLENIIKLIALTEDILFNHRDLSQSVIQRLRSNGQPIGSPPGSYSSSFRSVYEPSMSSLNAMRFEDTTFQKYESSLPFASPLKHDDMIFQSASNPWEESYQLAELFQEIVDALDKSDYWRTKAPIKSELKSGDICRIELRGWIAGISLSDKALRDSALDNLMSFVERHVRVPETVTEADRKHLREFYCSESDIFRQHILMLIGEIHEAFIMHKCRNFLAPLGDSQFFIESLDSVWQDGKFIASTFVQFVNSRDWMMIHDKYIVPAMKTASDDEFAMVCGIVDRFAKRVNSYNHRVSKVEAIVAKAEMAFDNEIYAIILAYREEENNRITGIEIDKKNDHMRTLRTWLSKFHDLTQERGVWSQGKHLEIHWKLDRRENYARMRRKLTINYDYDPHSEASAKRDKTPIAISPNRTKNINIHKLRKSVDFIRSNSPLPAVDPWAYAWSANEPLTHEADTWDEGEDEEWNLIAGDEVVETVDLSANKIIFSTECNLIVLLSSIKGKIELTATSLSFFVDRQALLQEINNIEHGSLIVDSEMLRDKKWMISDIREIHLRKHLLRRSAIELFLTDQTNYFFNFPEARDRLRLYTKIIALRPPNMINQDIRSPVALFHKSNLTRRWQQHEISNFEYLMHLNSIAGRSFNDLTQYFVFPWILSDYTSSEIDLFDPSVYRDLSRPVGALNVDRLAQLVERFESFEDPTGRVKPFLYGTHYSSAATVACYLIRLEPYTSVHIALQGGKFDHADRQFHSIVGTWDSCLNASGDVRELIPEFFYQPEFLTNHNNFDLGVRQDGQRLNEVVLPKWAKTPEEFIRIHREALESDYVSQNLHHWIDLIFGYKQTGEEAVKARNLFYYLTYEGGINIDSIRDEAERKAIEQQIYYFGQTPTQLLTKPHPRRHSRNNLLKRDILTFKDNCNRYLVQLISKRLRYLAVANIDVDALTTAPLQQIITMDEEGVIGRHNITYNAAEEIPFTVVVDPTIEHKTRLMTPFCYDTLISPRCFAVSKDGKVLISCGHWNNTVKITLAGTGKTIDSLSGHEDIVTAVAMSEDGKTLVTGSRSSKVLSWDVHVTSDNEFLFVDKKKPVHAFYGHDDEITCVAANAEHDVLLSGSKDGTCIVHSLRNAQYVRTLCPFDDTESSVEIVCISKDANLILYTEYNGEYYLHTYSINGKLLNYVEISDKLNDMIISTERNVLLTSDDKGQIFIYDALSLNLYSEYDIPLVGRSIALSDNQIYVAGDDGKLLIISRSSRESGDLF